MLNTPEKRIKSEVILTSKDMSDDLKLYEIFNIYKDDIRKECVQLYYALLGWKDSHINQLLKEKKKGDL